MEEEEEEEEEEEKEEGGSNGEKVDAKETLVFSVR